MIILTRLSSSTLNRDIWQSYGIIYGVIKSTGDKLLCSKLMCMDKGEASACVFNYRWSSITFGACKEIK